MSALDYARQHLFAPLGISDVQWNSNREWISFGYSGLYLRPDDMAKLGYLYLNGGRWDGQQVIPEGWVEASTRPEAPPPGEEHSWYDYGYQWWINSWQDYYAALGWRGQAILVVPRLDLVAIITSDLPSDMGYLAEDLLNFFIVPACEG
jgi:CubicO group peptidase (beta-lactamase class C family)